MLQVQQVIDAAFAADMTLQIKRIPGEGLNLGPVTQKAKTLPLSYSRMPYLSGLGSLKHKACKAALHTHFFKAAIKH